VSKLVPQFTCEVWCVLHFSLTYPKIQLISTAEMFDDWWMLNWKWFENKRSWSTVKWCSYICLVRLRRTTEACSLFTEPQATTEAGISTFDWKTFGNFDRRLSDLSDLAHYIKLFCVT